MVLSSMYSPGLSAEGHYLAPWRNNADSPREARKIWFFFPFTKLEQLLLATDGRFGVEPRVGGRGGGGSGDVRESTGNACYRKPAS